MAHPREGHGEASARIDDLPSPGLDRSASGRELVSVDGEPVDGPSRRIGPGGGARAGREAVLSPAGRRRGRESGSGLRIGLVGPPYFDLVFAPGERLGVFGVGSAGWISVGMLGKSLKRGGWE